MIWLPLGSKIVMPSMTEYVSQRRMAVSSIIGDLLMFEAHNNICEGFHVIVPVTAIRFIDMHAEIPNAPPNMTDSMMHRRSTQPAHMVKD